MSTPTFLQKFSHGRLYSLPTLEDAGWGRIHRLPVSIRIVLESVLRNIGTTAVTEADARRLAAWDSKNRSSAEIPFKVARVILQDFTGVPLLVDLAAMRHAVAANGGNPSVVEPLVPVDLVVDHSVQVDSYGTANSLTENLKLEFERNAERYRFLKWGQQAFKTFKVVPPGIGIVHQVNLEHLARVVMTDGDIVYPDTLVGTDSHTTMINGLGLVGWGVGGIEAEAGMLGQPVFFQTPEVVGVHLTGQLAEGVTATDLTLRVTELLRKIKVVDKFVEFFGAGAAKLSVADRATIANMAPEYGATMGYFPIDEKTLEYLRLTGRTPEQLGLIEAYYKAQELWGIPQAGQLDYSQVVELDLSTIVPSVSGPRRPQDRLELPALPQKFQKLLSTPIADGGYDAPQATPHDGQNLTHGSVVIAAITSCTNTSNPSVMVAAGLLAQKAASFGLRPPTYVKTSLAPGSRVVTEYLKKAGLLSSLESLGFNVVGYGCTTCIGNSGPLKKEIENEITSKGLITAAVLSGNRNFEARIHAAVKANFLMSPPLVVAFALAGRVDIDWEKDPIGTALDGRQIFLKDLWPTSEEIDRTVAASLDTETFRRRYAAIASDNPAWDQIPAPTGVQYSWDPASTYIQRPPFFEDAAPTLGAITGARILAILGDSVTTDHISPAGSIGKNTPAGLYLADNRVEYKDFNSYGSRRGNDRIMTRGTFANVRVRNQLADGKEGGYTRKFPQNTLSTIFDAAATYKQEGTPLVIFAGSDYGMGSSRDWAAKGTRLLGVRAVIAKSFERIHRSNLVGMGVIPLQLLGDISLNGDETIDLPFPAEPQLGGTLTLLAHAADGTTTPIPVQIRIDTPAELLYLRAGGILPFVKEHLTAKKASPNFFDRLLRLLKLKA